MHSIYQLSDIFFVKRILLHTPILFFLFLMDRSVCLFNTGCELLSIKMYADAIHIHQIGHDRFKFVMIKVDVIIISVKVIYVVQIVKQVFVCVLHVIQNIMRQQVQ